jgi:hypothetical protein
MNVDETIDNGGSFTWYVDDDGSDYEYEFELIDKSDETVVDSVTTDGPVSRSYSPKKINTIVEYQVRKRRISGNISKLSNNKLQVEIG